MTIPPAQLDAAVRAQVYDAALRTGQLPSSADVARGLGQPVSEIEGAFQRLADAHVLVLQRDRCELLMANPFSAVPTPFLVQSDGLTTFGNCIWDALGVPAMLGRPGTIQASCGCCGTAMTLTAQGDGTLAAAEGVVHFALPARQWWRDIVYN